jgi:UDP-glucose 4-epimerase
MMELHVVTGAAGFVGSQLIDRLLECGHAVLGIDNFSRGRRANLSSALGRTRFRLVEADLSDAEAARAALEPEGLCPAVLWHLAANSDIPAGVADASIDLRNTFLTTFNVIEAMKLHGIPRLAFASTSAVYGDSEKVLAEDTAPLLPISNYGAMKLASEAVISAAAESHLERVWIFRFPNVVGPRATHGVLYDLLGKLHAGATSLEVLGNGTQKKPYLHVTELIDAMQFIVASAHGPRVLYNIGPRDDGMTVRAIAETVVRVAAPGMPIVYSGGDRGWRGDVPRFRYSVDRLSRLGWSASLGSSAAIERAVGEIHREMVEGLRA